MVGPVVKTTDKRKEGGDRGVSELQDHARPGTGLIDALHACMPLKRQDEAERNLKRIANALNHPPG